MYIYSSVLLVLKSIFGFKKNIFGLIKTFLEKKTFLEDKIGIFGDFFCLFGEKNCLEKNLAGLLSLRKNFKTFF